MRLNQLIPKLNKETGNSRAKWFQKFRKAGLVQVSLVVGTILLVVVLAFAMTTAWYTNVAQSSTLRFQTESWGFDGKVTIDETPIALSPGAGGIIGLSLDNTVGGNAVNADINILKTGENTDLQKRLYFYVDEARELSGETVTRSYVANTGNAYRYRILGGQVLTLSADYYNDSPIRWQWVPTLQGYYFIGTVTAAKCTPLEYIRPISYDPDTAVFHRESGTDEYDTLEMANGKSTAEFLAELSAADGYAGTISAENSGIVTCAGKTFYKVAVDDVGYGVWAYLLDYNEIQTANVIDNELKQGNTDFSVNVRVTAMNTATVRTEVSTEEELRAALTAENATIVALKNDITLTEPIINVTAPVLDLCQFTLTYNGTEKDTVFDFSENSVLTFTVMNGTVLTETADRIFAAVNADDLTVSRVTATGFSQLLSVNDMTPVDSAVRLLYSTAKTAGDCICFQGNGDRSTAPSKLYLENAKLTSENGFALCGGAYGDKTEIAVLNSTLSGFRAGIHHTQPDSTLLVCKSTVTGFTGMVVQNGTVTVVDSTVTATDQNRDGLTAHNAGPIAGDFADTADGIYVDASYGTPALVVKQGKTEAVTSVLGKVGVEFFAPAESRAKVLLYGGTFTGTENATAWNANGSFRIFDGTFNGAVYTAAAEPIEGYADPHPPVETAPTE